MKKFVTKVSMFVLTFLTLIIFPGLIVSSFDNIDKNTSNNSNIISLQNKSNFENLDVLFLGNSYCYSSIKPAMLDSVDIKSYNLGIASAGVEFYELIINDYLNNVSEYPETIFLLITPMTFSSKTDIYTDYPLHRYLENPISNFEIAITYDHFDELMPMYKRSVKKGFSNIFSYNKFKQKSIIDMKNKGFIESNQLVNKDIISKTIPWFSPLLNDIWDQNKVKKLKDLTKFIKSKGIEVVYFELPTNQLNNYFSQKYLMFYEKAVKTLSKSEKFLSIDDSLFLTIHYKDIDHMNSDGATIATNEVIKYLNSEQILEN